jgi:hypothetical protein
VGKFLRANASLKAVEATRGLGKFKAMKIEDLRSLHQARPFRPFAIHTADGSMFPIPHSEFLACEPGGTTLVGFRTKHTFSILNLDLVTELEVLRVNGKSKRRTKK